jgi:hypothetical protein
MDERTQPGVTLLIVDDPEPTDRRGRLRTLLAVGVERWLRAARAVDSGADLSVYPDVDRTSW